MGPMKVRPGGGCKVGGYAEREYDEWWGAKGDDSRKTKITELYVPIWVE